MRHDLAGGQDFDDAVHHVCGRVRLPLHVVQGSLEPFPLLSACEIALAEHDQPRMELDVEQLQGVPARLPCSRSRLQSRSELHPMAVVS